MRHILVAMGKTPGIAPVREGPDQVPRPLRIVVADDDRDAVLTLVMVLREEGHEVYSAHSGQQALDAVVKYDPDAVLLDIVLPQLSGYEVARQIRARHGKGEVHRWAQVKAPRNDRPMIIGISGQYMKDSDRVLAEINGFHRYLLKPYEPSDVLRALAPLRYPAPK